jgi:hypothetical protein
MPLGRDQKDNTVRVLRLGAGVRVGKRERPAGIAAAVRRVLDRPAYAQAARPFAATLAAEAAQHPDAMQEAEALLTPDLRSGRVFAGPAGAALPARPWSLPQDAGRDGTLRP